MDRRWSFAALALSAALASTAGAIPAATPLLREMRWIAADVPRTQLAQLLTTRPAACLAPPANTANAHQIAIGQAMFSAPLLLGGQAARSGVSCAACHVGGRGNIHFVFPGVSGMPGTADVTSSLFSTRRGDGIVNPKPIPDLAADPPKISRDPASPALRSFLRGLIVEEFDGLEPPARILDGLAAYVRALRSDCGGTEQRGVTNDAGNAAAAVMAARNALAAGDSASARLLIGAARSALGQIDERFPNRPDIEALLMRRDGELRRLQADPSARKLARWAAQMRRDNAVMRAAEPGSLYAPAALERALASAAGSASQQ